MPATYPSQATLAHLWRRLADVRRGEGRAEGRQLGGRPGRPEHTARYAPLLPEQLLADEHQLARGVVGLPGHGLQLGLQAPLLLLEGVHLLVPRLALALQR